MSQTSVARGSALANKQFSTALSAMATRQPTPLAALTGPMPTHDAAMRKIKQQSTTEMPIVRVDELSKGPGDVVQVDCAHVVKLRPIMGDKNAEGLGAALKYSSKDITLDIAHRVAPLLSHELHMETLLTRDTDTYVPLELRTARANAFHADLFVSVHCNASENGQARGVQTFVFDRSRDPEGVEARVAARENAPRGRPAAIDARALDDQMASLFTNLGGADMAAKSRHVAELLHRSALASLTPRYPDTKDQGIRTAGFYVLVGADMPAVLFETSFISNPEDEARLSTADFRQKLADSIANAIRAYRDGK